jgi:hypothetical protein
MVLSEVFWRETVLISFETGYIGVAQASRIDSCYPQFWMEDRARYRLVSDYRPIVCSSKEAVFVN